VAAVCVCGVHRAHDLGGSMIHEWVVVKGGSHLFYTECALYSYRTIYSYLYSKNILGIF